MEIMRGFERKISNQRTEITKKIRRKTFKVPLRTMAKRRVYENSISRKRLPTIKKSSTHMPSKNTKVRKNLRKGVFSIEYE